MRIFNNFFYKLAALLIACVLWAATQGFKSVEEDIDVPVALESIPEDVVVVDQSPREINLRLVGSRAALRRAERQLSRYPISLAGVKPGEARFPVETALLSIPRGATVAARSPSAIVLRIDERIRKRVKVRLDLVGDPAPGYAIRAVILDPEEVELEGARGTLLRMREVSTDRVDVLGIAASEERQVRLLLSAPFVWRAGEDTPVRVRFEVRPIAPAPPGAE